MRYTLTRSRRKTAAIYIRNGEVEVRAPLRMPKREIDRFVLEKEKWIVKSLAKIHARAFISKRVDFFASQMSVTPKAVKINSAMKRWGSCSARKSLNFSWRLIMADDAIIDYVVVHELAHIKEMNHSTRFWAIVESVLPDFRERKRRLKELHNRLSIQDWG